MEKGIRTPIALTIGVPCAKFELLRIHTERDITKKGMSKGRRLCYGFAWNLIIPRVYLQECVQCSERTGLVGACAYTCVR